MREPKHNMVQYSMWANCCNNCDFCLKQEKDFYSVSRQMFAIDGVIKNIDFVDWDKFSYGVSLLGGELYYIKNKELQDHFIDLIDKIIFKAIESGSKHFMYSTVTNGMYDPEFLFRVLDRFNNTIGMSHVDLNFSYDLKYRYKTEETRQKTLNTMRLLSERYPTYRYGVQMILTQNVINLWKEGKFDIEEYSKEHFPNGILTFLYPHPIKTGKKLDDFFFKRDDFLEFMAYLRNNYFVHYTHFINSVKNSALFKYTGLYKNHHRKDSDLTQIPVLSDGKEILRECGHSELYRCYSDCDECMLCDLLLIEGSF